MNIVLVNIITRSSDLFLAIIKFKFNLAGAEIGAAQPQLIYS